MLVSLRDISDFMDAHGRLQRAESFLHAVIQAARDAVVAIDHEGKVTLWSPGAQRIFGYSPEEAMGKEAHALLAPPDSYERYRSAFHKFARSGKGPLVGRTFELVARKRSGSTVPVELSLASFVDPTSRRPQAVAVIRDITLRKRAENLVSRYVRLLESLCTNARELVSTLDDRLLAEKAAKACVEILGADLAWLGLSRADGKVESVAHYPADHRYPSSILVCWDAGPEAEGPTGTAIRTGQAQVVTDTKVEERVAPWRDLMAKYGLRSSAAIPLRSGDRVLGALNLYSRRREFFSADLLHVAETLASLAAAGLENAPILRESQERLSRLQALHDIDLAITSSFDPRVPLCILLEEVVKQLAVDAADVLILRPETQMLEFLAGRGFRSREIERTRLRVGEGYAGQVALSKQVMVVPDLREVSDFVRKDLLLREGFVAFACAPLVARGRALGVLETFHCSPLRQTDYWAEFLEALASQAAIAIENARFVSDLERVNADLVAAYDATIEGWSRAMDYRDKETEGHTSRVTQLTVQLARRLGVKEEDIVHMRRGALLHDMGKLGVPDSVLNKPGPLTEEEWELMRRHPQIAYEMLSPIAYLRPALDIPLYHHERWDGSGFPRGLKGEQIPLAARIFAVVDVWDALTSERPYRPAWSSEEARTYLREQAGRLFDPRVVQVFLQVLESAEEAPSSVET